MSTRDQVSIQLVMDDQGEVSLEYLADLVRLLSPEEIVKLLAHFMQSKKVRSKATHGFQLYVRSPTESAPWVRLLWLTLCPLSDGAG